MDVTLSPKAEEVIRQKVETGDYTSPADVIEEGVRLLQKRDDQWAEEVRRKIAEAQQHLKEGKTLTMEELERNLERRKAQWKAERGLK